MTEPRLTGDHDVVTFVVVGLGEAKDQGFPPPFGGEWSDTGLWDGWRYDSAVYRLVNGEPDTCIGTDGGEPEDQVLYRDWSWVAPALQAAYDLGRAHGNTA